MFAFRSARGSGSTDAPIRMRLVHGPLSRVTMSSARYAPCEKPTRVTSRSVWADCEYSEAARANASSMRARLACGDPRHIAPPLPHAPLARGQSKNALVDVAAENARHSFSGTSHMPWSRTMTGFVSPRARLGVKRMTGCSSAPTLGHRGEGGMGGGVLGGGRRARGFEE